MASVLLGPTWLDALMYNTHFHPSQRQLRQAEQSRPSKGSAVVCPDPRWQPILTHRRFADRPHLAQIHARDRLAANQIAAMSIGDGAWIAAQAIACHEVALEVHAPELVRSRQVAERFRVGSSPSLLPLRTRQTHPTQDASDGTGPRPPA